MPIFRVQRAPGGGTVVRRSSGGEEVGSAAGAAAGWAVASGIDALGAVASSRRERRMMRDARALLAAAADTAPASFLSVAQHFVRTYPREELGHAYLAEALYRLDRYEESEEEVLLAVELGLDERTGLRMLAEIREAAGNVGAALEIYNALVQDPDHRASALIGRAGCMVAIEDLEQAHADADAAVALSPVAAAYVVRGMVRRLRGDLEASLEDFDRAARLDPGDDDVQELRADVRRLLASGQDGAGLGTT